MGGTECDGVPCAETGARDRYLRAAYGRSCGWRYGRHGRSGNGTGCNVEDSSIRGVLRGCGLLGRGSIGGGIAQCGVAHLDVSLGGLVVREPDSRTGNVIAGDPRVSDVDAALTAAG